MSDTHHLTGDITGPITGPITWSERLLTRQPAMDATHREFVDHLRQVQAALDQPDAVLLSRYDTLLAHTVEHFEQEDRWMVTLGFAPQNCHSMQHAQVLAVLRDVRQQHVAAAGRTDLIGRLLPELMHWFENHVQAADAGLASYMDEVGFQEPAASVACG